MKHHHALLCALVLASVCATSGMAKPTPKAATPPLTDADKDFLTKDAQSNLYDLTLAQLATGRATEPTLHSYGVALINDYARLDSGLLTLGRNKGISLPVTLSDDDKARLDGFQAQSGSDLDNALLAEFVRVNGEDVQDGQQELSSTHDAAVKRAVEEAVKTKEKHLGDAQRLQKMQAQMVIK